MTSCLYGFVKNGEYKLAYNNSDSHPDRFGKTFVHFIKSMSVTQMHTLFDTMRVHQMNDMPNDEQVEEMKSRGMKGEYRGDRLRWIDIEAFNGGYISYCDRVNFVCDYESWMDCRSYLYVADLDNNAFIVYEYDSTRADASRGQADADTKKADAGSAQANTQGWRSKYIMTTFPLENIPVMWFNQLTPRP